MSIADEGVDITNVENLIIPEATEDVVVKNPTFSKDALISSEYYMTLSTEIEKMNFIEVSRVLKELLTEISNLKQSKDMIEQLQKADVSLMNKEIQEANIMKDLGIQKDFASFMDSYEEDLVKLELLSEKAELRVRFFDGVEKTTTFLNQQMLDIIDQKMKSAADIGKANNAPIVIYYRTMKDVFTHRTETDYFVKKISTMTANIARMKREIKKSWYENDNIQKFVVNSLTVEFSSEQLKKFEEYITELFGSEGDTNILFLYVLATIYNNTKTFKKTGEHKWVEVMIMNIIDMSVDVYDLEGGKEYYNTNLLKIKSALLV